MMVCDICMTPDPEATGSPTITVNTPGQNAANQYMFAMTGSNGSGATGARVDFCKDCLELLRLRAWDKIAEKAHDVLMLRLGVSPDQKIE